MNEDLYWIGIDIANGLLSGTMLGGYYAVISIGLALNFGVMRQVNLAHGDWLIVAAYLAVAFLGIANVSPFWTLAGVIPVMYGVGWLIQRVLLARVSVQAAERRGMAPSIGLMSPLLVTFGMSIVIGQGLLALFDANAQAIRNDLSYAAVRLGEDLSVSTLRLVFFVIAVAMLIAVQTFLNTTHAGRAIRAAADDPEVAALMGMHPARVHAVASGISLATAGVAGVMIGMSRSFQPFDGPTFLLVAFGVVILGGLGSMTGALVGGVILGITQVLSGTYFGPSAQLVGGYILILLVLAVKPQGLFSK
ncbi:MAG: branched-chain amino acid ABC transporter permease [Burkholderiales bacterium]|jgi:branched-chain amino acid transport system permease protein|nr:branched-chain amino acid ABC transporter permease [Burkholderiales bacterium]